MAMSRKHYQAVAAEFRREMDVAAGEPEPASRAAREARCA